MTKRYFHNYKKEYGQTQTLLVQKYHFDMKKTVDEIQQLLKCPRPSIRRVISEYKRDMIYPSDYT